MMFLFKQLAFIIKYCRNVNTANNMNHTFIFNRKFHLSLIRISERNNQTGITKEIALKTDFENIKNKTKNAYLDMVKIFIGRDVHRRGHVEFIYSAMKSMEEFGVHKDLEVYKALIDVLPKGKFIPQNMFQAEFMHYPKQQQCAIDLLEQMEDNGVMPDFEVEQMLLNIFGKRGHPLRKFWRMMYWMPKFKNLSPWAIPNPPPNDSFELAQIAIARICSVDIQSKVLIYQTIDIPDATEDTWIVSGQSIMQRKLLDEHKQDEPIYVEGSYKIWLKNKPVNYFILRTNPKITPEENEDSDDVSKISVSLFKFNVPKKSIVANLVSVHEQEDGVILAVCATGTSSKSSLLSWIRHLEKDGNAKLATIPIVFTLKTAGKELTLSESEGKKEQIVDE